MAVETAPVERTEELEEKLAHFEREGWVIFEDVFDPERDFAALFKDFERIAERLADDELTPEQLAAWPRDGDLQAKLMYLAECAGEIDPSPFDPSIRPTTIATADRDPYLGKPAFELLRHPKLLDVVEPFVGPEIYSCPIQHARLKVPERFLAPDDRLGRATPWHQDHAVQSREADDTDMITAWVALSDAMTENGCLKFAPGSHRQGLAQHCPNPASGVHLPDGIMSKERTQPLPVRAGSVIVFSRHLMHGAMPNLGNSVRMSLDLRFQHPNAPSGRSYLPGFIARSRSNPSSELRDHREWRRRWIEAHQRLVANPPETTGLRWDINHPLCA